MHYNCTSDLFILSVPKQTLLQCTIIIQRIVYFNVHYSLCLSMSTNIAILVAYYQLQSLIYWCIPILTILCYNSIPNSTRLEIIPGRTICQDIVSRSCQDIFDPAELILLFICLGAGLKTPWVGNDPPPMTHTYD